MNRPSKKSFACPIHKTAFIDGLFCPQCNEQYPSINGIPILINDANSIFSASDYTAQRAYEGASSYAGSLDKRTGIRQLYRRAMHRLSETAPPKKEFGVREAVDKILISSPHAEILVVGSGDTAIRGDTTYTDVAFGENVTCIADAHDLPFVDMTFDACIAVAVLEHVVDPHRCVQEIRRVLRPGGYVYAETPFMQPVHMGAYDFTRFTHLGHRRLFRHFEEICSGIAGGPGTSAGQLLRYALASVSDKPNKKRWLKLLGIFITYPFRWLDYLAYSNRSAYDSASGFYFFGVLREQPISDRDLLGFFRGG
jgi:SAM-dependent methyltransferase